MLDANDVRGEPVVWEPPLAAITRGMSLPGDDPHAIDVTSCIG